MKNTKTTFNFTGKKVTYDDVATKGGPIFVTKGQPMSDVRCEALAQLMMKNGVSPKRCY